MSYLEDNLSLCLCQRGNDAFCKLGNSSPAKYRLSLLELSLLIKYIIGKQKLFAKSSEKIEPVTMTNRLINLIQGQGPNLPYLKQDEFVMKSTAS